MDRQSVVDYNIEGQPEVFSDIFSRYPSGRETMRSLMSTLSKTTRTGMSRGSLIEMCSLAPALQELEVYLNTFPPSMCVFMYVAARTGINPDFMLPNRQDMFYCRYLISIPSTDIQSNSLILTNVVNSVESLGDLSGNVHQTALLMDHPYISIHNRTTSSLDTIYTNLFLRTSNPNAPSNSREDNPYLYSRSEHSMNDIYIQHMVDVKTFFNISKQRGSCTSDTFDLVRQATINYFTRVLNSLSSADNILFYRIYLIYNAQVLGITVAKELIMQIRVVLSYNARGAMAGSTNNIEDYITSVEKMYNKIATDNNFLRPMIDGLIEDIVITIQAFR